MTLEKTFQILSQYSREEYFGRYGEIEGILKGFETEVKRRGEAERMALLCEIEQMVSDAPAWMRVHVLSFCMKMSSVPKFTEECLEVILNADYNFVGEYNKLYYYWQIRTSVFQDAGKSNDRIEVMLVQLYRELFEAFRGALHIRKCDYIPLEERNKGVVFVFTGQVLTLEHAPTKTLFDRCYVLQKYLKKRVVIINTAMQNAKKGAAPFYGLCEGAYLTQLRDCSSLEFQGESFEFYQCANNMPDIGTIGELIALIKKIKPHYIVDIGGNDICADLCGMFVPQITISTVFSRIATSCGEYQLVDKDMTEHDRELCKVLGVSPENVKRVMFTFVFKEQTHTYTREELGLWKDKFILLVVGWRLDTEVTGDFLEMLLDSAMQDKSIKVAFMGRFTKYEEWCEKYLFLKQCSVNLGMQEDALAVTECCDLYVNPMRQGGGSSVSEALFKGLPAVTLPMGDVATAAGDEFWVNDYVEMKEKILEYANEKDVYQAAAERAKIRARHLMDSNESFGKAIKELEEIIG